METYEIPVIGQGELLVDVFQAVSALSNNQIMSSMLFITALIGAGIALFSFAVKGRYGSAVSWILCYIFVYGCLFVPRVNVAVNDASDATVVAEVVSDVPFGVAFPAYAATTIGNRIALAFDTVISPVNNFSYRNNKALWGPRFMEELGAIEVTDARVRGNLDRFFQICVFPEVGVDDQQFGSLTNTTEMETFLSAYGGNLKVDYQAGAAGSLLESVSCTAAYTNIVADMESTTQKAAEFYSSARYSEELVPSERSERFFADAATAHNGYMNISKEGPEVLRQILLINSFKRALSGYAAETGNSGLMDYIDARSRSSFALTASAVGGLMQSAIPLMYTLIVILLVSIFPIVIVLSMLPNVGLGITKNYLSSFLYIQAYPILFVIFNALINILLTRKSTIFFSASSDIDAGISYSRMAGLAEIPSEAVSVSLIFLTLIPMLMNVFTKGVTAVSGALESTLASYQNAANTASAEAATGNISLGNTSYASARAFKFDTNQEVFSGAKRYNTATNAGHIMTPNGRSLHDTNGSISNVDFKAQVLSSVGETLSSAKSEAVQAQESASRGVASETQKLAGNVLSYATASESRRNTDEFKGFNSVQGLREGASGLSSQIEDFAKRNDISTSVANQAAASLAGNFNVGRNGPSNLVTGGVGVNGSLGLSKQVQQAASMMRSQGFMTQLQNSSAMETATQALTNSSSSSGTSDSRQFNDSVSESLQNIEKYEEAQRASKSLIDSATLLEQKQRSNSGQLVRDMTPEVQEDLQQRLGHEGAAALINDPYMEGRGAQIKQSADNVFMDQLGQSYDTVLSFNQQSVGDIERVDMNNQRRYGPQQDTLVSDSQNGLINAHTDAPTRLAEGFGEDAYFWNASSNREIGEGQLTGQAASNLQNVDNQRSGLQGTKLIVPFHDGTRLEQGFGDNGHIQSEFVNEIEAGLKEGVGPLSAFQNSAKYDPETGEPQFPEVKMLRSEAASVKSDYVPLPEEYLESYQPPPSTNSSPIMSYNQYNNAPHVNKDELAAYEAAYETWEAEQATNQENYNKGVRFEKESGAN